MKERRKVFDILYDQEDWLVYGSRFCRNSTVKSDYSLQGKPYSHWTKEGKVMSLQENSYILLNPVLPNTTRKKENISKFRSFLLESDTLPLEDQLYIFKYAIKYHNLPLSYLMFSGNKSYHGVITLEEPITVENPYLKYNTDFLSFEDNYHSPSEIFTNIHQRMVKKMDEITVEAMELGKIDKIPPNKIGHYFDVANKDVTRLSRFPEGKERGRNRQKLMIVLNRATKKKFVPFLRRCPKVEFYVPQKKEHQGFLGDFDKTYSKNTFMNQCSGALRNKIAFFENSADSSEMHTSVRGFFLQIFKEFSKMTRDEALEVAEDYVFPHLIKAGYEQAKLYKNTTIDWCYDTVRRK